MKTADPANRFRRPVREPSGEREPASPPAGRRWLRIVVAIFGSLVLLWLVLRVSIANAMLEIRPQVAAALAPDHPELAFVGGPSSPGESSRQEQEAIGMLAKAPLAHEPLLVAARGAVAEGDATRADRLLDRALRRNPRSRYVHLLRLDRQFRQDRVEDAAVTVALLSRLLGGSGNLLIGELARMAEDPEVRGAIARIVENDGGMRLRLLEELAREGADSQTIFSLAGALQPAAASDAPRWQVLMLEELISRGRMTEAREAWRRMAGVEQPQAGVYDSDFTGLPGPPPFNWHFEASSEGFAELARGEAGLYAEYYGRKDAVLGGQLLTLPAGRYRLTFEAEGSATGEGGRLAWTVTCHPGRRSLTTVPIAEVDFTPETIAAGFTVPSGCAAQWLRLTGKFGEFSKDQRVTIRNLRIVEASGS